MVAIVDISFGPKIVNLYDLVEGDSWALPVAITQSGAPYDLTGATLEAIMNLDSTIVPVTVTVTNAVGGLLTLSQAVIPAIPSNSSWAFRINTRTWMAGRLTGHDSWMT